MRNLYRASLIALALGASGTALAETPTYRVVDRIPGPDGGYDYISVDSAAGRLFVGRRDGVMAVDLADRNVIPVLTPGQRVAAVLQLPDGLLLSTNRRSNTAMILDRASGALKATINVGQDPDAAAYDPFSGLALVMNGESHDMSLIDLDAAEVVGSIPLGGAPEAGASDGQGKVYVNIEDTAEIAVVDMRTRTTTRRYALPGCEAPTGIAFDPTSDVLMSACQNRVAIVIDAKTGEVKQTLTIGLEADGAIFDPARRLLYIPCNEGMLEIFSIDEQGKASKLASAPTQAGAYTAALDEKTGRIYLPAAEWTKNAEGEDVRVAGTFNIIVVAPQE